MGVFFDCIKIMLYWIANIVKGKNAENVAFDLET